MNKFSIIVFASLLLIITASASFAQTIATLEVSLNKDDTNIDVPVRTNLDDITAIPDSSLALIEILGAKRINIPYQIENKGQRVMYWLIKQSLGSAKHRIYELIKATPAKVSDHIRLIKDNDKGILTITANNKNLLQYNFKTVYPPKGIDTAYRRSGFIHPLWSPRGDILTRIQAPDHYHHYGLWAPWTHVAFDGDTVDFWNLNGKQGTVRFANFASVTDGPVFGDYQALQQHVAFKRRGPKKGTEKLALNELQSARIYQPSADQDYYIADITIQLNPVDIPFKILAYRYAGLGWRGTEKWGATNSEMLTSEGKTRDAIDNTTARWMIVQGAIDNNYAGAVMMSNPTNYSYPEPLRVWDTKNNRGMVYANFSPTKDKDWLLTPGNDYVLKYRFLVFNNKGTKERAEAAWQYFAHPPLVKVKLATPPAVKKTSATKNKQ
jgi:hypothetical protein